MRFIRLIFECYTHCLLDANFQELYLPLVAAGIVGFALIFIKRRMIAYV